MTIDFVRLTRDDLPLLATWFEQPHVRRWWLDANSDPDHLEAKYGPRIDGAWPEAAQRARALDGLVADGLVEPLEGGTYQLPTARPH